MMQMWCDWGGSGESEPRRGRTITVGLPAVSAPECRSYRSVSGTSATNRMASAPSTDASPS